MPTSALEIMPIGCDANHYEQYVRLFDRSFPKTNRFSDPYLHWLYSENPNGKVIGFDAWNAGQVVAHYACVPGVAEVRGEIVRVLLSLNTATHPDFQGRGLFTKLAEATYERATNLGFDCVYGVANHNSTPGFISKLGFQLVAPLRAEVGVGGLNIQYGELASVDFRRIWSERDLNWRARSPLNRIVSKRAATCQMLLAQSMLAGAFTAVAEIDPDFEANLRPSKDQAQFLSPGRLFLGTIPKLAAGRRLYLGIPRRLRPSPLNLIYKSLSGRAQSLDEDNTLVTFVDFDAY